MIVKNEVKDIAQDSRGAVWGFLPNDKKDLSILFAKLAAYFGSPELVEELVVFFKYHGDVRLKISSHHASLVLKTKINEEKYGKYVTRQDETKIPLSEVDPLIHILKSMGYERGLFSVADKYIYQGTAGTFTVRFNEEFGNFFQLGRPLQTETLDQNINAMKTLLRQLDLTPWSDEEYEKHISEVWDDVRDEALVDTYGTLNSKVSRLLIKHEYSSHVTKFIHGESLAENLKRRSNQYDKAEKTFKDLTGFDLLSESTLDFSNDFSISGSIIVPTFNNYDLLEKLIISVSNQNLTRNQFKKIELIVVDDGSDVSGLDQLVKHYERILSQMGVKLSFVRSYKNQGRSVARNLGATVAKGDVLIFLDADIVLHKDYIKETLVRHQAIRKLALIGFKENVLLNDPKVMDGSIYLEKPDISRDFRVSKVVQKDWHGLYPVNEDRVVRCLDETMCFKNFGFGNVVGPFDLPCMFVTHNVSMKRSEFESIGGFEKAFERKWGFEDTYMGARLISENNFIVPLLSTGVYHLDTVAQTTSGEKQSKYRELSENYPLYMSLLSKKFCRNARAFV